MSATLDQIYSLILALDGKVSTMNSSVSGRLGHIETRLGNLESAVSAINGQNLESAFHRYIDACQQAVIDCENQVVAELFDVRKDLQRITDTAAQMEDCYNEISTCAGEIRTKSSEISVIVGTVSDLSTTYATAAANVGSAGTTLSNAVSEFSSEVAQYKMQLNSIEEANASLVKTISDCAESIRDTSSSNLSAFKVVTVDGFSAMLATLQRDFDEKVATLSESLGVVDAKVLTYAEQIKNAAISLASYSEGTQSASIDLLRTLDVANQVIEKVTALASKVQLSDMTLQTLTTQLNTLNDSYKDLKRQLIKNGSTDRSIRVAEAVAASVSAASDAKRAFAPAKNSSASELLN
jgi:chromosome segregation ATPase